MVQSIMKKYLHNYIILTYIIPQSLTKFECLPLSCNIINNL